MPEHVVIVGASAAGTSTADALRSHGFEGRITLVGDEPHLPYDRPPLSKQLLKGASEPPDLALRAESHFEEKQIEVRRGVRAVSADARKQHVTLADGTDLRYDRLVVATGVAPRRPSFPVAASAIHELRTLDDALALRGALGQARRIVVIGGGVLGTELAATARALQVEVILAAPSGPPMSAVLGREVGEQLLGLQAREGVGIRTGAAGRVVSVTRPGNQECSVEFEDGERITADVVAVAAGSIPSSSWLEGSGIPIGDGVECAEDCSAGPGVYAAGDVARWHNRRYGVAMRVEHRTNAIDQALHVAEQIVSGERTPYAPVPYFWSDQFGVRLQAHGYLRGHQEVRVIEGSLSTGRMIALYRRGDRLTGVVAVGAARAARMWRGHLDDQISWRDALASI